MNSNARKSPLDQLSRVRAEICDTLHLSSEHASSNVSRVLTDVKAWSSKNAATLHATPAGKSAEASFRAIGRSSAAAGRNVRMWTDSCAAAISWHVTGVRRDFDTLRQNVRRNVHTLTSGGEVAPIDGLKPSALSSSAASATSYPTSTKEVWGEAFSPPEAKGQAKMHAQSYREKAVAMATSRDSSVSEVSPEEDIQSHQSVNATSVFSIGSVGSPLLTDPERYDETFMPAGQQTLDPGQVIAPPFLRLQQVRRFIGKALIIFKMVRSLGLRENSWENKMPWRRPAPPYLAKGLRWPQERFSSVAERTEYHRRMRRRGRYLIGPTPGWSWFAADVLLLHVLINNHTRNFLM